MRMPETREEVIANILAYDDALRNISRYKPAVQDSLAKTISRTMGWLHIRYNGEMRAGPIKFCGSAINMTPEKYAASAVDLSGSGASKRIGEIFFSDDDWDDYEFTDNEKPVKALRRLAREHDRELKSSARFWGLPGEGIDDTERAKVARLLKQITEAGLTESGLHNLRVRL